MHRRLILVVTMLVAALALVACADDQGSAQKEETEIRQAGYEILASDQPAKTMSYSPSRKTINQWIDTWDEPGKLSYVYLLGSNGQLIGYYVFEGLPVTYCAALTPSYEIYEDAEGNLVLPAPGVDGVYYSGSGGCNTYYGFDATTGAYMEYTVGNGISHLIFEEPMPRQDVEPLGFTIIEEMEGSTEESAP